MIFHGLKIKMEFPGSIQTYVNIRTTLFDIGIPGCLGRTIKIKWLFGFSQLDRLQTDFTHGHPSLSRHLDSQQQNHMATRSSRHAVSAFRVGLARSLKARSTPTLHDPKLRTALAQLTTGAGPFMAKLLNKPWLGRSVL